MGDQVGQPWLAIIAKVGREAGFKEKEAQREEPVPKRGGEAVPARGASKYGSGAPWGEIIAKVSRAIGLQMRKV